MGRLIDADALMVYCNNLKDKTIDANDIARFPTAVEWISVKDKDRLPKKTKRYMCLCYDFVTKSYWHELLWHENNRWWKSLATLECDYTKHVVYWMPLSEPPKEDEDAAER